MCLRAALVPHRPNKILPPDSVQRNCFKLALYTTRDHDCISNRIGSGIRTCPRCGCRLVTFGALPTPSTIYREIIMLNNHRFWGHASGPSSSSGKTRSSFHPLLARPCRSALPRERFSPMTFSRMANHHRRDQCPLCRCITDAIRSKPSPKGANNENVEDAVKQHRNFRMSARLGRP